MGLNLKLSEYTQQVKLMAYDMDANSALRPSAMLYYCREACELHLTCYGLMHEKIQGNGITSMFARIGGVVYR